MTKERDSERVQMYGTTMPPLAPPLDDVCTGNDTICGPVPTTHNIAGTDAGTNYSITLNPAQTNVFYRLRHP